ncbi:MAG: serine/threonine protein kinase [Ktedonobacteraceae bacterium]|nr:serine/threonine protein kinase [Ktedonobacteraceae bacterium]
MDVKELIGVTLGTCTLEQIIGRGGMGAVFLAQQSRPTRTVAVKVLMPTESYDPELRQNFLERFRREADTVAKLEHKNILPVYEYDEAVVDGLYMAYLVMPYIRGGTLRERIDEMQRQGKQFDLRVIVSYLNQVADALDYAHNLGVVHRDVKPGNLLFHLDGRLLLSDFGIVRLKAMPSLTTVGDFLGTAEYASPEQVNTGEIDFRSDIYSLGIILYELLAGTVPFTATNPFAIMTMQVRDPVPPIRGRRPEISPEVEAVVLKALEKDPAKRYQSALDLARAFQKAVTASVDMNAVPSASALRLGSDGNNNDRTFVEPQLYAATSLDLEARGAPSIGTVDGNTLLPTSPARSVPPDGSNGAPWQQEPKGWQWPSQVQAQVQQAFPELGVSPLQPSYRESHRIFYYGTALCALLAQFPTFVLLFASNGDGGTSLTNLGVLLGSAINLLILAAIGFAGIVRTRSIGKPLYRCLGIAIIALVVSGFFMSFGVGTPGIHPVIAFLVLLASNIYAIRQLAQVDVGHEQIEVAPVHWRPALAGALTGLLPLAIILILVLTTPVLHAPGMPPLLIMLDILLVAVLGAPTPGAVLAVWLSEKMTPATLVRSSAIAGMLMFFGAFLLVTLWGLTIASETSYFSRFHQPWIPLLVWAGVLGVVGLLRGLLDSWLYLRIKGKKP